MNIVLLMTFCLLVGASDLNALSNQQLRGHTRKSVSEKKTNLVLQLDMPDNQEVPEFTIYFNGTQQRCDDNGMATFALDHATTPEKWYLLITKHLSPAFVEINTLATLRTLPEKEYLYYSLRWDEKPRQWIITKKDLKDKNLEVPKPNQCVIINMHPRHIAQVGKGEFATMPQMHAHMLWLPRIELKDFPNKTLARASKKSLLCNQDCRPMHKPLCRITQEITTGRTPVRTAQLREL